jgi:hypothetical protein
LLPGFGDKRVYVRPHETTFVKRTQKTEGRNGYFCRRSPAEIPLSR